ncbi:MAG: HPr(Ser) kinase/phosphatase [Mycoplasmatales bacterium]
MIKLQVKDLMNNHNNLTLLTNENTLLREIKTPEIARPGLSLITKIDEFPYERIQVYGLMEVNYMRRNKLTSEQLKTLLNPQTPLIIFSRDLQPDKELIEYANQLNIAVAISPISTTKLSSIIHTQLEYELALTTQVHGVLLSIYGEGVLIQGRSGIGKSEVALELVQKKHVLVADDSVVIRKIGEKELIGSAPDLLKNRMEIRGIGIVDIQRLYGTTAVAPEAKIDLVIELNDPGRIEDRIGNNWRTKEFLETEIKMVSIPVFGGRSVANMIEVAVANHQLRTHYNYDSSQEFIDDLAQTLKEAKEKRENE